MQTKHFEKGDVIFKEGTFGSTMYEITSGMVRIYSAYGTEDEKLLTDLEPGRIFGEMAVIEVSARSATAVAVEPVEAVEISTEDMQEYFQNHPEKLMEIMRGLSRRIRELTADYREVCGTIREWQEEEKKGQEKGSGLLAAIRKFASIFLSSTPAPV